MFYVSQEDLGGASAEAEMDVVQTRAMKRGYSKQYDEALALAADAFRDVIRKGSGVPYLSHLLQVSVSVMEYGGDEEQCIAALLHDYLEDIPEASFDDLEAKFGSRVARLVLALSDSTTHPKPPWRPRKEAYIAKLKTEPAEVKLISAADKLHNASSIIRDHKVIGEEIWDRFTAEKPDTLWYYREVLAALRIDFDNPILEELKEAIEEMHRRAGVVDLVS